MPNTPTLLHKAELTSVSELKPYPGNARVHTKKQIAKLTTAITTVGWTDPIVADEHGMILAGHGRYLAALEIGLVSVPVIRLAQMTEAEKRRFMLSHNHLSDMSWFDPDLLANEFDFLVKEKVDLDLTSFDMAEIDQIIGIDDLGTDSADNVKLPEPDAVAVSRPGDLWRIGDHRILCGDARDWACYEALLSGERAQMIFTDPPFNVRISGNVSGLGKTAHREFAMASGEMSDSDFISFLRTTFKLMVRAGTDGAIHYVVMDWRHMRHILDAADGVYSEQKNLAIWNKLSGSMGTFYRSQHELIFIFKSGRAPHINNFGLGEKGRYRTNVWDHPGASTFRKGRKADLAAHPTVKPVGLVADAILDCSDRGGLILDVFGGSGTTLSAAARTGRRGAAIEIDPLYVDCAVRRLEQATGLTALHADGETFAEKTATRAVEQEIK